MGTEGRYGSPPTRTVVTSGSSMGSGVGISLGFNRKTFSSGLSFSVFLMREPLNPTKATPAMTVIKDIHLHGGFVTQVAEIADRKTELV